MTALIRPLTEQITLIDLQFQGRVEVIAAYLIYDGDTAALVETGPASTADTLLEGVQAAGVPLEALRQIFVTHIHLDHSGAAGVLAGRLPWTTVYVHPVGAPHLSDPSKLLVSAARIYGDKMETLWGRIAPVPAERIVTLNDGDAVAIPGSTLRALATPGHAKHHHTFFDERSALLFTGDVAGVRLPGVKYVRPPTPPPELDLEEWRASIAKLRAVDASGVCPTHFGLFRGNLAWHWNDLEQRLVTWGELTRAALARGEGAAEILARLKAQAADEFRALKADPSSYDVAVSYESLVAGYVRYWSKKNGG